MIDIAPLALPATDADVRALAELLVDAVDAGGIVESVQLHPAWVPNQPHRADITMLLVHRRFRRASAASYLPQSAHFDTRHWRRPTACAPGRPSPSLVLACLTGAGTLAAQEKAMRAADAKAEADDRIADKPHEKLLKDHLAKIAEHERVRGAGLDEVHMQLEQHHRRIEKIHADLLKRHLLLAAEHRAVEKAHDRSSDSARMVSDHERMTSEHSQSANDHPRLESDHELMSAEHEGMLRDHLALPKGAVAAGTGARNADAKSAARKKP